MSSSSAWAIKASATRPDRCAWRPESSGKTSKMANCESPSRTANHAVVSGSSSTSERPPSRNFKSDYVGLDLILDGLERMAYR